MALGAAGALVSLAACSGASNAGGDTACRDFVAMRSENMDATVARMLKERDGRNSSTTDVVSARTKVLAACQPADKADVKIGELG